MTNSSESRDFGDIIFSDTWAGSGRTELNYRRFNNNRETKRIRGECYPQKINYILTLAPKSNGCTNSLQEPKKDNPVSFKNFTINCVISLYKMSI